MVDRAPIKKQSSVYYMMGLSEFKRIEKVVVNKTLLGFEPETTKPLCRIWSLRELGHKYFIRKTCESSCIRFLYPVIMELNRPRLLAPINIS